MTGEHAGEREAHAPRGRDWSWIGPAEFIVLWCLFWTPVLALGVVVIAALQGWWFVVIFTVAFIALWGRYLHRSWVEAW